MYIERFKERKRNKILEQFDTLDENGKLLLYYNIKNETKRLSKQYEMIKKMHKYLPPNKPEIKEDIIYPTFMTSCGLLFSFACATMRYQDLYMDVIKLLAFSECIMGGIFVINYLHNKKIYKDKVPNKENKLYKSLSNIEILEEEIKSRLEKENIKNKMDLEMSR